MTYTQGFLIPVPTDKKAEYIKMAELSGPIFMEYGALRVVENWGDIVPDGKVTDFKMAVKAEQSETVVFSWIVWPDKETYEQVAQKMETDPRWHDMPEMPFDGKRLMWGGFSPIYEANNPA